MIRITDEMIQAGANVWPRPWEEYNLGDAIKKVLEAVIPNIVLESDDGKFLITAESAWQDAYLISCAEAAIDRDASSRWEIGDILGAYAACEKTFEETMEIINEDLEDDEA